MLCVKKCEKFGLPAQLVQQHAVFVPHHRQLQIGITIGIAQVDSGIAVNRETGDQLGIAVEQVDLMGLGVGYDYVDLVVQEEDLGFCLEPAIQGNSLSFNRQLVVRKGDQGPGGGGYPVVVGKAQSFS